MNEYKHRNITPEGHLENRLFEALVVSRVIYKQNGKPDFDAGLVKGLKMALEIVRECREKKGVKYE